MSINMFSSSCSSCWLQLIQSRAVPKHFFHSFIEFTEDQLHLAHVVQPSGGVPQGSVLEYSPLQHDLQDRE